MGNFDHIIAKVQLGGSELAIVVSIVVCCVLLLLCTVGRLCSHTLSVANDGCVSAIAMQAPDVEQIKGIWGSSFPALASFLFSIQ